MEVIHKVHKLIKEYVTHRQKCQINKVKNMKAKGLLHPLEISNGRWKTNPIDAIVGLLTTDCGQHSIRVVEYRLINEDVLIDYKYNHNKDYQISIDICGEC